MIRSEIDIAVIPPQTRKCLCHDLFFYCFFFEFQKLFWFFIISSDYHFISQRKKHFRHASVQITNLSIFSLFFWPRLLLLYIEVKHKKWNKSFQFLKHISSKFLLKFNFSHILSLSFPFHLIQIYFHFKIQFVLVSIVHRAALHWSILSSCIKWQ